MLITTTDAINGKPVKEYLGVVTSSKVVGVNIFRDLFTKVRDVFGGTSRSYETVSKDALSYAIDDIMKDTEKLRGNAIVGLRIQQEPVSSKGSALLLVNVYGTACVISDGVDSGE